MNWDNLKKMLTVIGVIVSMTVASMLYYVPATAFHDFKRDYEHDRAMRIKRDLRREVRECQKTIREFETMTPLEEKYCDEAAKELEDISAEINARWGAK